MMAEQTQQEPKTTKRKNERVWLAIGVVLAVIIACFLWSLRDSKSVNERFAAIEAARAIPDSQNAATIYNQLLQDPNATLLFDYRPEFLDYESFNQIIREPWLSKDYPELAAWIKNQQAIIDQLFAASKFEECRFPIVIDTEQMSDDVDRMRAMNEWAYLLRFAANNDIAEGRIDAAIAKWRCMVRMGIHLRQQLLSGYYLMGIQLDSTVMDLFAVYIVEGDAVKARLSKIESIRVDTKDNWTGHAEQICLVLDLMREKLEEQLGPIEQIKYLLDGGTNAGTWKPADLVGLHKLHLRNVASRRGNHILIALRRYKNKDGVWPQSLDEIEPHVSAEALIDPFNDGPFVYRLTEDSFTLYSKGRNRIDENAKYRDPFDDWPIWPPRGKQPKTKEQNADPNQPDTSTEPVQ